MTENKRIILNVVATYGRSLLNVLCGLFSVRWVLEALGHDDYGLYGVIGGLVVFVEFINGQFSGAICRFYAVSIGNRQVAEDKSVSLEDCREWFTISLLIHIVLPCCLVAIGYPIGALAIEKGWIAVPIERIETCIWIWRFVCINVFTAMVVAPIWAMYIAKQNIAELTVFGVVQTLLRTGFIFYMTTAPGDWLMRYGIAMCLIGILPRFLYCAIAVIRFEECRLRWNLVSVWMRVRQLIGYASWRMVESLCAIFKGQGFSILVNNRLGANVNAAMSVGSQLSGETAALTGALVNAFRPAIITAYGAGDLIKMRSMVFRTSKFGTLLTLVFAIPLMAELNQVLMLWLKEPPVHSYEICATMIICFVIEKISQGHTIAIDAFGKLGIYCTLRALSYICSLLFLVFGFQMTLGVRSILIALIAGSLLCVCVDIVMARIKVALSLRYWIKSVLTPVILITIATSVGAVFSLLLFEASFFRVFFTSLICLIIFLIMTITFGLDFTEREYIIGKIKKILRL